MKLTEIKRAFVKPFAEGLPEAAKIEQRSNEVANVGSYKSKLKRGAKHRNICMNKTKLTIKLLFGFCSYLLISIFYQKFFGEEPFNNSFSIGLPRFYFEFYASDGIKLNGSNFLNFIINIVIYMVIVIGYYKFLSNRISGNDGKQSK